MKLRWSKLALGEPRRLTGGWLDHDQPCPTGDGRLVHSISGRPGRGLILTDAAGRLATPLVLDGGEYQGLAVHAGAGVVLYGYRPDPEARWKIRRVSLETASLDEVLASDEVSLMDPAPFPDDERLLFASDEGGTRRHLWELELGTGNRRPLTAARDRADDQPTVSPSGRFVAFRGRRAQGPSEIWLLDRQTLEARQLTDGAADSAQPVFLDDHRVLFSRRLPGGDGGLLILDTLRCRERWLTGVLERAASPAVQVGRKGRVRVLYSAERDGHRDLFRARLEGVKPAR